MTVNPYQLSHEEYLIRKKNGTLTPENRAAQFGDARLGDRDFLVAKENEYRQMLIDRMEQGLPMTKAAIKDAKRFKREGPLE